MVEEATAEKIARSLQFCSIVKRHVIAVTIIKTAQKIVTRKKLITLIYYAKYYNNYVN